MTENELQFGAGEMNDTGESLNASRHKQKKTEVRKTHLLI